MIRQEIFIGNDLKTIGNEVLETENLDLLGGFVAGADIAQVIDFAALGRPRTRKRVGFLVEFAFPYERGNNGDDQDQQEPWIEGYQTGAEEQHRDQVLRLAQDHTHQCGAAGGLGAGAFQFVVKIGVFKLIQVERGCMADDPHGGIVVHQIAQQAVGQHNSAAQQIAQDSENQFEAYPEPNVEMPPLIDCQLALLVLLDHCYDLVDNFLAYVQGQQGHGGLYQAEQNIPDR